MGDREQETRQRKRGREKTKRGDRRGGEKKRTNDVRRLVDRGGFALCPLCSARERSAAPCNTSVCSTSAGCVCCAALDIVNNCAAL